KRVAHPTKIYLLWPLPGYSILSDGMALPRESWVLATEFLAKLPGMRPRLRGVQGGSMTWKAVLEVSAGWLFLPAIAWVFLHELLRHFQGVLASDHHSRSLPT